MHRSSRVGGALVFALAIAMGAAAGAEDDDPGALACEFNAGHAWSYEGGAFRPETPAGISFEIADIDVEGQAARLLTGNSGGAGTLRIVRAINANHYLEVVTEGFLNLTTIYDRDPATGTFPAVHSRHFGLLGQPVFAQYTGVCRAR
jgi:hypothetical protein